MKSILKNRRLIVLWYALAHRTLGGSISDFVRNTFGPTMGILAKRQIEKIEDRGDCRVITFAGIAKPFYFPLTADPKTLEMVIAEQFYSWQWHYYEVPETRVDDDVVLDCGAAEGLFAFLVRDRARQVFCFEPLPEFQECLGRTFAGDSKVTIVPCALGATPANAYLKKDGVNTCVTLDPTPDPVRIDTIDEYFRGKDVRPSYLKADLEGYEMFLLEGAQETIRECKPKIAITTYHKARDAENIMAFLKRIHPAYRFKCKGIEAWRGGPLMLHAW